MKEYTKCQFKLDFFPQICPSVKRIQIFPSISFETDHNRRYRNHVTLT